MIYPYRCLDAACAETFEVIKAVADIDNSEACPKCGTPAQRYIARTHVHGSAADWNTQTWNPALGCYTKSTKQARDIAKSRGMEEVGTEKPETIHKHFDKQREETRAQRWREADREMKYE